MSQAECESPQSLSASSRVGVEVEFVGIGVHAAATALAASLGGGTREEDPHAVHVEGSSLGNLRVELDMRHVHPHRGRANPLHRLPTPVLIGLGRLAAPLVPRELVVAPLDRARLGAVNGAIAALHGAGARGDGATLLGSLGLHFNVEHRSPEPRAIVALFKAFLTLEPWLRQASLANPLDRLHAPPPYPRSYVERVLDPSYWPTLALFGRDYVAANPTRKRSLDMLPLLLHHEPGLAPRFAGKVKPRPALHYRLPDARVGRPGWTIDADWERWLEVERLAAELLDPPVGGGPAPAPKVASLAL